MSDDRQEMETTVLDQLFIELSQFTRATTARESQLLSERHVLLGELAKSKLAQVEAERHGMERCLRAGEEEALALSTKHSGDQQLAVRMILEAQRSVLVHIVGKEEQG